IEHGEAGRHDVEKRGLPSASPIRTEDEEPEKACIYEEGNDRDEQLLGERRPEAEQHRQERRREDAKPMLVRRRVLDRGGERPPAVSSVPYDRRKRTERSEQSRDPDPT